MHIKTSVMDSLNVPLCIFCVSMWSTICFVMLMITKIYLNFLSFIDRRQIGGIIYALMRSRPQLMNVTVTEGVADVG